MSDFQSNMHNFERKIVGFIESEKLFTPDQKILLAISGGPDSVALFSILLKMQIHFAIAHCNFNLRGEDSARDEQFIIELAQQNNIECFIKKFNTKELKKTGGASTQMLARELRYNFFNDVIREHNFDCVTVATNLNDQIETSLLNFTKGTGIKGLTGIKSKRENIVRPLLVATKKEIIDYLTEIKLPYRIDKSNLENNYQRNAIRNLIIPELEKINPNITETFLRTIKQLTADEQAADFAVEHALKKISITKQNQIEVDINALLKFNFYSKIIWQLAEKYGFSSAQSQQIESLIFCISGKVVESENYTCLKDRNKLIFYEKPETTFKPIEISKIPFKNQYISLKQSLVPENFNQRKPNTEYLCIDESEFPLILRKWKKGDKVIPLGMKNHKKVSDILIDKKIPLGQKQHQLVLTSNSGKIIWLVGVMISNNFKLRKNTKKAILLSA